MERFEGTALFATFAIGWALLRHITKDVVVNNCKLSNHGCDDCSNSLFYGSNPLPGGKGYPLNTVISDFDVNYLKQVHKEYRRLSDELYSQIVANTPTACVDVVCQRVEDGRLLLFLRRDAPAAGVWWWPGGRIFKGESFFDTCRCCSS